jgi:hypothetical protein
MLVVLSLLSAELVFFILVWYESFHAKNTKAATQDSNRWIGAFFYNYIFEK